MNAEDFKNEICMAIETDRAHARTRLWLANTLVIALFLLSIFNGDTLERWAASQAPNWANETVRLTAKTWAERMDMVGLHEPKNTVREAWNDLKRMGWQEIAEADTEAEDAVRVVQND